MNDDELSQDGDPGDEALAQRLAAYAAGRLTPGSSATTRMRAQVMAAADRQVQIMSGGHLKLVWAGTENLGDWSDVRKRITENMNRKRSALLAK